MMRQPEIHDEDAWQRGKQRRIYTNASVSRRKRWLEATPDAQEVIDFLNAYEPVQEGRFLEKMAYALCQWGALTDRQEAAVRKIMVDAKDRKAAQTAADAASQHVGQLGERREFRGTVRVVAGWEGAFGFTHLHVVVDDAGNVLVHKGSSWSVERGDVVSFKATIKKHDERNGVKQTVVTRPSNVVLVARKEETR